MGPGEPLTAAAIMADELRNDGNIYFKINRLGSAIDAYTEAIKLCPNVPVYWTNRALCHRKLNDWIKVESDCRRAIQLDNNSVKAHYMLGLALSQKKECSEGIKELQKALDIEKRKNPNSYMVEEIWQELANATYMEWKQESEKQSLELQSLKQSCVNALKESHLRNEVTTTMNLKQLECLEKVFKDAEEANIPSEVPDYLCCRITLDIYRDPVITPSGITYERAIIINHLRKVGKFDPVTRQPLRESQLVSNLAIKAAVRAYLDKHGWAYGL